MQPLMYVLHSFRDPKQPLSSHWPCSNQDTAQESGSYTAVEDIHEMLIPAFKQLEKDVEKGIQYGAKEMTNRTRKIMEAYNGESPTECLVHVNTHSLEKTTVDNWRTASQQQQRKWRVGEEGSS